MPERNDDLVQALHVQQNELRTHIQAIDDLLTHYETPEKILVPLRRAEPTKKTKKAKSGPGNKTTPAQIQAMKRMYENGIRVKTICEKIGCSDGTVYHYAKINNWNRGEE